MSRRSNNTSQNPWHRNYQAFIRKLADNETLAYIDETFRSNGQHDEPGFYCIIATLIRKKDIPFYHDELLDIVGIDYWHSTKALRDGREETFLNFLHFMHDDPTMNIIVVTSDVHGNSNAALENARKEALGEAFASLSDAEPHLRGFVLESRNTLTANDSDRSLFRQLQKDGTIPTYISLQLISPSVDRNLWMPDIAGMAYRRSITHKDQESGSWFKQFLEKFTFVKHLEDTRDNTTRVLEGWLEQMKRLQDSDPNQATVSPTPGSFLSLQERIRLQLQEKTDSPIPGQRANPNNSRALMEGRALADLVYGQPPDQAFIQQPVSKRDEHVQPKKQRRRDNGHHL